MSQFSWRTVVATAVIATLVTVGGLAGGVQATVGQADVASFGNSTQTPVVFGYDHFLPNAFLSDLYIVQSINRQTQLDSPELAEEKTSHDEWAVLNQSGEYLAISDAFTISTGQVGFKPLQIKPPETYFVGSKKLQSQSSRLSVAPWTVQLTKQRIFLLDQDVSLGPRDSRTHWKVSYDLIPKMFRDIRESTRHALLQLVENQQITSTLQYLYTKSYLRFLS